MFASQRELPPAARAEQERIRRSHHPLGLARAMRAVGLAAMPDYRPWLDRVRTPTRLVAGERDAKFRRLAGEMAERMPRADVVVVEDAGHNVVLEQPEVVARLIRQGMERA